MTTAVQITLPSMGKALALLASPAVVIFLSSNVVNVGNLAFNMLFSRWMGPALFGDLAVVLTIKLALLGVLSAVSAAVSQRVAGIDPSDADQNTQALARLNRICFVGLWFALPVLMTLLAAGSVHQSLDLASPLLLIILACSLPFCAPLNILRGVALGQLNSRKVVLSANIEMAVRLGLAVIAWQIGLGITGVVAAIALSLVAGWAVLFDVLPMPKQTDVPVKPLAASISIAVLPFAVLQLAQVAALDADIFVAARFLGDVETGHVAALSLFQRIQFFACFALASVLLPSVVISRREGTSCLQSVLAIVGLLGIVSATVLTTALAFPTTAIALLVGNEYSAAAPFLLSAVGASIAFTANYLIASFLIARGSTLGVVIVACGSLLQIMLIFVFLRDGADLATMLSTKLNCQCAIFAILLAPLWIELKYHTKTQPQN